MPAETSLHLCPSIDRLPDDALRLLDTAGAHDYTLGREWFRNVVQNGLKPEARAWFAVLPGPAGTLAVLPLREERGCLGGLANCYTCVFTPLLAHAAPPAATARRLGREFGRLCRLWPLARLDALPAEWPALGAFVDGLRQAGSPVRCFADFGNWQEMAAGRSWPAYLAARPGALRELLRRKSRQAARAGGVEFETIRHPTDVPRGIAVYEAVYRRSWKPDEPYPRFNPALIKTTAASGMLRLGIAWHRGLAVAAQLWVLAGGRATVMKLAHDPAYDVLSPGTLLTARMIESFLQDGVAAIDFGRGDDAYKRLWASERRRRIGVIVVNPLRVRGLLTLARHDAGLALRPLRSRLRIERRAS